MYKIQEMLIKYIEKDPLLLILHYNILSIVKMIRKLNQNRVQFNFKIFKNMKKNNEMRFIYIYLELLYKYFYICKYII